MIDVSPSLYQLIINFHAQTADDDKLYAYIFEYMLQSVWHACGSELDKTLTQLHKGACITCHDTFSLNLH